MYCREILGFFSAPLNFFFSTQNTLIYNWVTESLCGVELSLGS
jgi:hypothetical protein